MSTPDKYFIITAGPTGSGKTKLVDVVLQHLKILKPTDYTFFLIDELVENDPDYIKAVDDIVSNIENTCRNTKDVNDVGVDACIKNSFDNPTDDLLTKFEKAYFDARKNGCTDKKGCDDELDNKIKNIRQTNPSVVVFEITGVNIPSWLLNDSFIPQDYIIIFAYSLVNIETLIKRNKLRAYTGYLNFRGHNKKSFRLPNIKKTFLDKTIAQIISNLEILYNKCITVKEPLKEPLKEEDLNSGHVCGTKKIHRLFVSDNNKE